MIRNDISLFKKNTKANHLFNLKPSNHPSCGFQKYINNNFIDNENRKK